MIEAGWENSRAPGINISRLSLGPKPQSNKHGRITFNELSKQEDRDTTIVLQKGIGH